MSEEEYKDIPGFPKYRAAKSGSIQNKLSKRYLTPDQGLYPKVNVIDEKGKARIVAVHILVARAWVENPDPMRKIHVNHSDGKKNNPNADNLEWVTRAENAKHARASGLFTEEHRGIQIENIDPETDDVLEWFPSIASAKRQHHLDRHRLEQVLDTDEVYKGYLWITAIVDDGIADGDSKEKWQDIKECDGFSLGYIPYSVSSYGRVRNKRTLRHMYAHPDVATGYWKVSLSISYSKTRPFLVSRLVATVYIEKPETDEKLDVDHKDTNIDNNHTTNLQWLTKAEHMLKTHSKRIVQRDLTGKIMVIYESGKAASEALKVTQGSVSSAVTKEHNTCGGFVLDFDDDVTRKLATGVIDIEPAKVKVNGTAVTQRTLDGVLIATHKTMVNAAKAVGCAKESISRAVRREGKYHHGRCKKFIWDYAPE